MSLPVLVWVLRHSPEKLGRRLTLIALAEFAHDDGSKAFPSVETLTERTRMSRRAVQTALRDLVAAGAIEETGKTQSGTKVYRILMGGADSAPRGEVDDTEGAQNPTEGGEATTPDPSGPVTDPSGPSADEPPKLTLIDGRNVAFDALAEACGVSADSPRVREVAAALNGSRSTGPGIRKLVWREIEGTWAGADEEFERFVAQEIGRKARAYRARFADAEMTPTALAKWWTDLRIPRAARAPEPAEEDLFLPATPEERAENAKRMREMTDRIGRAVE